MTSTHSDSDCERQSHNRGISYQLVHVTFGILLMLTEKDILIVIKIDPRHCLQPGSNCVHWLVLFRQLHSSERYVVRLHTQPRTESLRCTFSAVRQACAARNTGILEVQDWRTDHTKFKRHAKSRKGRQ